MGDAPPVWAFGASTAAWSRRVGGSEQTTCASWSEQCLGRAIAAGWARIWHAAHSHFNPGSHDKVLRFNWQFNRQPPAPHPSGLQNCKPAPAPHCVLSVACGLAGRPGERGACNRIQRATSKQLSSAQPRALYPWSVFDYGNVVLVMGRVIVCTGATYFHVP